MKSKHDFPRARPGVRDRLEFIVGERAPGKPRRLDRFLQTRFPGYSRSFLQQMIKSEKILLNDKPVKTCRHIAPGEKITFLLPEGADRTPEEIPFEVLYEDEHLLALSKPPGVVVHPARGHKSGTLFHGLLYYFREKLAADPSFHIGTVHRLDIWTSGVMIYALDKKTNGDLTRQFENRLLRKTYLCLVHGTTAFDALEVDAPLGNDQTGRKRGAVNGLDARPAQSRLETLARVKPPAASAPAPEKETSATRETPPPEAGYSLLRVRPRTGRAHQVRLHSAHVGHPLVGDLLYGGRNDDPAFGELRPRVCLHAESLYLRRPADGEPLFLHAPLPDDLKKIAARAGLDVEALLSEKPPVPEPLGK